MTTKAITPLRQRMIEDMNGRKLCPARSEVTFWLASGLLHF